MMMNLVKNKTLFDRYNLLLAILLTGVFMSFTPRLFAQELDVKVTIDKSKINSASIDFVNNLKPAIENYLNNFSWTSDRYLPSERIHASLQVILNSVDNNYNFEATVIIQSQRPVYNTTNSTPVMLLTDTWNFQYAPNQSLVHNEFRFSPLASQLDFYAYLILGYDYDTFSPLGGTPLFRHARKITDMAQSNGGQGWSSGAGPRSRYSLITDLLDPNYEGLRQASYEYHRQGLDLFTSNTDSARKHMYHALELIQQAQQQTTDTYPFSIFFNTKFKEIVSAFRDAGTNMRLKVYRLLSNLDPAHLTEYEKLRR